MGSLTTFSTSRMVFGQSPNISTLMQTKFKILYPLLLWSTLCQAENPTLVVPQAPLIDTSLSMREDDEFKVVEQLIDATSRQLEAQKQMKELMLQFKAQREEFIQGRQTKSHTGKMVRTARQIYELIAANHLEHLFAKDYLDELTFFSSIAGKSAITKP